MHRLLGVLSLLAATTSFAVGASDDHLLGAQALLNSLPRTAAADKQRGRGDSAEEFQYVLPAPAVRSLASREAAAKLKADLADFGRRQPAEADAGGRWAALFERWYALGHPTDGKQAEVIEVSLGDLMQLLPAPSVWPRIAVALRQRHVIATGADPSAAQLAVITLADLFARDDGALGEREAQFKALVKKTDSDESAAHGVRQVIKAMAPIVAAHGGDATSALFLADLQQAESADTWTLRVPDLVTAVGEQRAAELLRQALAQSVAQLEIPVGDATRALAAKLALQDIEHVRRPQWNLVRGLDCARLYEAFSKRFSADSGSSPGMVSVLLAIVGIGHTESAANYAEESSLGEAKVYYFAALVAHGRNTEAEAVAEDFPADIGGHALRVVFEALGEAGYDKQVYSFLDEFLVRHPSSDLWARYLELAARTGRQDEMLAHVRASLLTPSGRSYSSTLRTHLVDALLAADKLDEAVGEIQSLLADASTLPATRSDFGLKLAELGRLRENVDWIQQGLAADESAAAVGAAQAPGGVATDDSVEQARLRLLRRLGRYVQAERMLARELAAQRSSRYSGEASETLVELVGLYHDAGRDADVLVVLDKAPDWATKDLANRFSLRDVMKVPLGYYAAVALHGAGNDARALPILQAVIEKYGGFDPAYALYTQIRGQAAIAYLDKIYAGDQFEERPLIWKASLFLQGRKLEDAERVARSAIAIDPSDGEEGPGDRMRVYAVLADILDARGNSADAVVYRNAVQAIRESERADEFRLAGLHTHAIGMYAKALERFADAYCIQSRLAVELNASGNSQLAQEHYRRAYELMPSSFGRMESHCLGCENVFGGGTAQGIAEKVFSDLSKTMPASPQVHYLFGYLREEQERYAEALSQYRVATSLDSDYLNAWKHQYDLSRKIDIPLGELDRVTLRLYALDPFGRHTYVRTDKVSDWPALYMLAAKILARQPQQRLALYPLAASRASIDAALAGQSKANRERHRTWSAASFEDMRPQAHSAGGVIAQTELMQALSSILQVERFEM